MLYVVAFFLPPLACLMVGKVLESFFNAFLWFLAFLTGVFLPPVGFVFWLLAFLHAGFLVSDKGKLERREEVNALLTAQGKPPLPAPVRTGTLPGWLSASVILGVIGLFVGGGILSQRPSGPPQDDAAAAAATTPTLTVPPSLALPGPELRAETPTPAAPELPAISAWSFAEVVKAHGEPEAKDRATGWATWPTFKARFTSGKVEEIAAR